MFIGNRIGFKHIDTNDVNLAEFLSESEHEIISVSTNTFEIVSNTTYSDINIENGYVMNLSLQTNFGFNVKTMRHIFKDSPTLI